MKIVSLISLLLIVAALAGCDTVYGITRYSNVGAIALPVDCIVQATEKVSGVSFVEHRKEEGGRELTLGGIQPPEVIDRFLYAYGGLNGNFYFLTNFKGIAEFRHTYIDINRRPPQTEIDKIRPVMVEIENSISEYCVLDLSSKVIENCSGVECGGA